MSRWLLLNRLALFSTSEAQLQPRLSCPYSLLFWGGFTVIYARVFAIFRPVGTPSSSRAGLGFVITHFQVELQLENSGCVGGGDSIFGAQRRSHPLPCASELLVSVSRCLCHYWRYKLHRLLYGSYVSASTVSAHVITQLINIYSYIFVRRWGMGTRQRVSGHAHHACVRRTVRAPFLPAIASSFELLQ